MPRADRLSLLGQATASEEWGAGTAHTVGDCGKPVIVTQPNKIPPPLRLPVQPTARQVMKTQGVQDRNLTSAVAVPQGVRPCGRNRAEEKCWSQATWGYTKLLLLCATSSSTKQLLLSVTRKHPQHVYVRLAQCFRPSSGANFYSPLWITLHHRPQRHARSEHNPHGDGWGIKLQGLEQCSSPNITIMVPPGGFDQHWPVVPDLNKQISLLPWSANFTITLECR